jgi:1,4-alpha-glucan branching enzyme
MRVRSLRNELDPTYPRQEGVRSNPTQVFRTRDTRARFLQHRAARDSLRTTIPAPWRRDSFRDRTSDHASRGKPVSDAPLWYKDAVFYELHVKAFHDSNGDGIGDFNGLIQRLDYVQELGVSFASVKPQLRSRT